MAAQAQPRAPRDVVEFAPNVPVTVALKYAQGKTISNQYGDRIMYSLMDGRVMFLDLPVAAQIEAQGINVRESFTITRRSNGRKDAPVTWEVARIIGEQPDGTFVAPALPPAKPMQSATAPTRPANSHLVDEANALVDAYAQVLERALTTYQGKVKPDEVRALLITSYIQRNKLSSVA